MTTPARPNDILRIACRHFSADDVAALRRLLVLLEPHLKRRWALADGDAGDLLFVNLDAAHACMPEGGLNVVGCATKPRLWPEGTLHRPLRPAGVLAALSAYHEAEPVGAPIAAGGEGSPQLRYRMRSWPLHFSQWPQPWWAVLAAINHTPRSVADIAAQVGIAESEVRRCLAELEREALLECHTEPVARVGIEHTAHNGWRSLVARVGLRLGFGR